MTTDSHIWFDADGVAFIDDATTKVVEIVQDHLAHHWDAFEIRRQHPTLGLAQIHAALAYYYDHLDELNQEIEARRRRVAELRDRHGDATVAEKLRRYVSDADRAMERTSESNAEC